MLKMNRNMLVMCTKNACDIKEISTSLKNVCAILKTLHNAQKYSTNSIKSFHVVKKIMYHLKKLHKFQKCFPEIFKIIVYNVIRIFAFLKK